MNPSQPPVRIPVCSALLDGNEARYLEECIRTGWVSSSGPFVNRFESAFSAWLGCRHAVTASSGTAALHLALAALGIGPGDEVILPSMTMVATGNAVLYTGAVPIIADVQSRTGNLDPEQVARLISPKTKAVMAVHLYGLPCSMGALRELCDRAGVALVEDAAEAIGTTCAGKRAGTVGQIGCFSFFANKVLTCGEGGMVVTDDDRLAQRLRRLKDQWFVPERRFFHPDVGFNYRLTNLQAAVGLAQLERVEALARARLDVARRYGELLHGIPQLELPLDDWEGGLNSHWMYAVRVKAGNRGDQPDAERETRNAKPPAALDMLAVTGDHKCKMQSAKCKVQNGRASRLSATIDHRPSTITDDRRSRRPCSMLPRDELAAFLDAEGIETRTAFLPLEQLPAFARLGLHCPVSASWAREGLLLPTGPTLTPEAQGLVADSIRRFLGI